jgi:hypothetical protein
MLSKVQLSRVQLVAARWGEQGLEREEQNETQPVVGGGGGCEPLTRGGCQ